MAELDFAGPVLSEGGTWRFPPHQPLQLDSGAQLENLEIAYRTWGELNADGTNAVLICHALTGDQHVAGKHPVSGKPGWWTRMVGPGRPIDPAKHFIICSNVVGGCMGSTGPASINPDTGRVYRLDFPELSIEDGANAAYEVVKVLGIGKLACVIGNSMGGMTALALLKLHEGAARAHINVSGSARAITSSRRA